MGSITQALSCICCCCSSSKYPDPYDFQFNSSGSLPQNQYKFQSNYVKTSKYTFYNFLPFALLVQYKRIANLYFLAVTILYTIPNIAMTSPITAWTPYLIILGVSLLREGYEDYQRYKSDRQMNHESKTYIMSGGQFGQVQWGQVKVGDICRVKSEELFPADLLLLGSSNKDGSGSAFIQTASLDGQKNLKPRYCHEKIKYNNLDELKKLKGKASGKIPNKQVHNFSLQLTIDSKPSFQYSDAKSLLYRGARLKNTNQIYGLVIYTGKNSKILMNSQSSSQKMSQIQLKINRLLVYIFILQLILCGIGAIFSYLFTQVNQDNLVYLDKSQFSLQLETLFVFFRFFTLVNTMIPISLIISMQMVKLYQSRFIQKDMLMFSQYRDKSVSVKSSSLNQQLGQIQHVFTDKTGTLTMNKMEFKIALIGEKQYKSQMKTVTETNASGQSLNRFFNNQLKQIVTEKYQNCLKQPIIITGGAEIKINTQLQLCNQFLCALSLAHEVIPTEDQKNNLVYQGPSPDQITLVDAARSMSYQFIKLQKRSKTVKIAGVEKTFQILQTFEFNSDRKRMSVIIKQNNVIKMYTKGADNIINERRSENSMNLDTKLKNYSSQGYRTLLIAMKTIQPSQYQQFVNKVQQLRINSNQNLTQQKEKQQYQYNKLVSQLQNNLYIIGATAVLDRLQEFVPETIKDLIRANIKVWMLTGDKMETAQNIAKSCNLFGSHFKILRFNPTECKKDPMLCLEELIKQSKNSNQSNPIGLLIQGPDLSTILTKQSNGEQKLIELVQNCSAVACCRLTPSQKANLIEVVRKRLNKITLAIGDGANDVPMIKAAHIGVGLFGQEGMNAVQACDYALPQFRMLWRLLFVHGRWNYIRISEMILYFFYKNILYTTPQIVLSFFSAFSAESLYDPNFLSGYNLIFTAMPLIVRAVMEQDLNYITKKKSPEKQQIDKVLQKQAKYLPKGYQANPFLYKLFPKIYFMGQSNCIFNNSNFFAWVVEAACEGVMIFCLTIYMLGGVSINSNGLNNSFHLIGVTTYSTVIWIVTLKIVTHTKFISKIFIFSVIFLSLILYLTFMWITNTQLSQIQGTAIIAWTAPKSYLTAIISILVVLILDGIIVHIDFKRGGYASKMREIIDEEKQQKKSAYDRASLKISQRNSLPAQYYKNVLPVSIQS